jgi:hypothetical protein
VILLKGQIHDRTKNFLKDNRDRPAQSREASKTHAGLLSSGRKRSGPIKQISDKQAEKNKIYERTKREWRKERTEIDGFRCQYEKDGVRCSSKASLHPHHKAGRVGAMLYTKEHFLAVCARHHRAIHDSPKEAYALGYMIKRI